MRIRSRILKRLFRTLIRVFVIYFTFRENYSKDGRIYKNLNHQFEILGGLLILNWETSMGIDPEIEKEVLAHPYLQALYPEFDINAAQIRYSYMD